MITKNKLDKTFGITGAFSGILVFVAGLIISFFSMAGLFLVLIGAFVGFSSTSCTIDLKRQKIKFSNNIFGIFSYGKWINIDTNMKVGLKKSNKVSRSYSRSNRVLEINNKDYRLILYDFNGKEIMPIQKFHDIDSAKQNQNKFSNKFNLELI